MKIITKSFIFSLCSSFTLYSASTSLFFNPSTQELTLFDTDTNKIQSALALVDPPADIALTPDNANILLSIPGTNSLDFYSATNPNVNSLFVVPNLNSKLTSVAVGTTPVATAVTPDGLKALVANYGSSTVSVVDIASKAVTQTVSVQTGPVSINVTPDGTKAVVANNTAHSATIIDLSNYNTTHVDLTGIEASAAPYKIAITPNSSFAYLTDPGANFIYKLDLGAGTATGISVGAPSTQIATTPAGKYALALTPSLNQMQVINTTDDSLLSLAVGANPVSVTVTSTGSRAYVANYGSKNVSVIGLGGTPSLVDTLENNFSGSPLAVATTQDQKNVHILYDTRGVFGSQAPATLGVVDLPTGDQINGLFLPSGNGLSDPLVIAPNIAVQAQIAEVNLSASQAQRSILLRAHARQLIRMNSLALTKIQEEANSILGLEAINLYSYPEYLRRNNLLEN